MDILLPQDVLEAILGFVEVETLCTARLVSRNFCAAASTHVCSMRIASTSAVVPLRRFPRLGSVTFTQFNSVVRSADLAPDIRDLITIWRTSPGCLAESLSHLPAMPKLRELDMVFHIEGVAPLLRHLTSLERVKLECSVSVATMLMTLTSLTHLCVGAVYRGSERGQVIDVSWLQLATNLRNLQALELTTPREGIPLIANLTGLTGLTWTYEDPREAFAHEFRPYSIAPCTRLTRLRSFFVGTPDDSQRNLRIACSLGSGSLLELTLQAFGRALPRCGRFLKG
jgi:hypothetical protein